MKREPRLRLVTGGGEEPPFSEEERAAAAELRHALEDGTDPLALALGAAHASGALAPADLDAVVRRAMGDDDATTSAERAAAERLRIAIEAPEHGAPDANADLARALRAAAHPTGIRARRHEALLEAALPAGLRLRAGNIRRIAPVTMAALVSVAAMAAGIALFAGPFDTDSTASGATALLRARSAEDLFDAATPFPRTGAESARVDRIASARASDLRKNRFTAWGVK